MKLVKTLINTNIYISLAAVSLTVETQIQLGIEPQWHLYLIIIFFATLFEYNIHRLITITTKINIINSKKYEWVRENLKGFYFLIFASVIGFICVSFFVEKDVLLILSPIALLTLFYSIPVFGRRNFFFRLREIPYLKIFLIAFVWSSATILLPLIQSNYNFDTIDIVAMLAERFFFVFAITIPFDIRDIKVDKQDGLKTIPMLFNENKALAISCLSIIIFFVISLFHYQTQNRWFIVWAVSISAVTTFVFIKNRKIRALPYYHYGVLDGTMLLQGLLVFMFYYFNLSGNS